MRGKYDFFYLTIFDWDFRNAYTIGRKRVAMIASCSTHFVLV
jgi:hypothetical protein